MTRPVTRYGRADTTFDFAEKRRGVPTDLALGARRARAGSLLTLALPGTAYIYQGEELGLEEVEDLDDAVREDPMFYRSGGRDPGRDGCRVPIPWAGDAPPFGFSPDDATSPPWLPQPAHWQAMSVAAQTGDPTSTLELYRAALRMHRAEPGLGDGEMTWLDVAARRARVPPGGPVRVRGQPLTGPGSAARARGGAARQRAACGRLPAQRRDRLDPSCLTIARSG